MPLQTLASEPGSSRGRGTPEFKVALAVLGILLLTSVHHVWGAYVFDTPFRLHIVFVAIPAAAVIVGLLYLAANGSRRMAMAARWAAIAATALLPIVLIGIYEGGYNHVLKNAEYFLSGAEAARARFPAPTYEMPSDLFFEASGAMQFAAAILAIRELWRYVRAPR